MAWTWNAREGARCRVTNDCRRLSECQLAGQTISRSERFGILPSTHAEGCLTVQASNSVPAGGESPVKSGQPGRVSPLEVSDSRHVRLRYSSAAAAAATRRQRRVPPAGMHELMFVSDGDRQVP